MIDRLVGTRAVAERLGVSMPTATRMMATGVIRSVRVGGRLKSRLTWITEYLERVEVRPEKTAARTRASAAHVRAVEGLRRHGIG